MQFLFALTCTRTDAEVQCIEKPTKWAINNLNPLKEYAQHRVILAGDAVSPLLSLSLDRQLMLPQAHAMTPHQGAGAGQAIEVRP